MRGATTAPETGVGSVWGGICRGLLRVENFGGGRITIGEESYVGTTVC